MLIDDYFTGRLQRGEIAESSVRPMRTILRQWLDYAGPIEQWDSDTAARWVHDQTLRPNSRKNRLTRLRPYIQWLVRQGHIERDFTADIPRVKVPRPRPRDIDARDVSRLLAACPDDRAILIVLLMVHCGLRCVDVSRVRVEDIDMRRTLDVRAKGGQGEVTHTVPIPTEAWDALCAYMLAHGLRGGALIRNRNNATGGITPKHVSILVQRWIKAAGLKRFPRDGLGAHSLRHSCAQHIIDGGADIRQVQHVLGHRQVTTTEIYLRREPAGLREAVEGRHYLDAA